MSDCDVAIVGASIAGCTTATLLGRAGASVTVVESHADPKAYKRMCTHLIQPSASPTLHRLGLIEQIEAAGGQPNDLNIWTRYGWISYSRRWAQAPMRDHPAWNIRRETLDPMLRELAASTDGVELLLGCSATELVREDGPASRVRGIVVRGRDGSEREIRAQLVIAADGRESSLAKLAGIEEVRKPNNRFGYFAHYRDTPLVTGSSAQLWMLDPDVAYGFPTDGDLTLLTVMPHKRRMAEFKSDPEGAMARLFETLPQAPRVDPAKRVTKMMGKLDMPNIVRPVAHPGLALVGDAAISSDPLWGVGCGFALQSAEWLADALAPALGGGEAVLDGALEGYARRHHRGLAAHERFCSEYSDGHAFNLAEKLLFRAAARDRVLAGRMSEMGGRWIQPEEVLTPATLARMVRVNLSPGRRPNGLLRATPAPSSAASRPAVPPATATVA